jgi:hypothetical protein
MPNYEHVKDSLAVCIGKIVEIHFANTKKLVATTTKLEAMLQESKMLLDGFTSFTPNFTQSE